MGEGVVGSSGGDAASDGIEVVQFAEHRFHVDEFALDVAQQRFPRFHRGILPTISARLGDTVTVGR